MILTVRAMGNLQGAGVYSDGKRLKFKKIKNAAGAEAKIETDGHLELSVIKRSPLGFKNWFGKVFLFWLFGIFGLFTPRYKKQYKALNYKLEADISSDAEMTLRVGAPNARTAVPPVIAEAAFAFSEEGNTWYDDAAAKKHRKYYHIFNALFWILLLAGSAVSAAVILLFN